MKNEKLEEILYEINQNLIALVQDQQRLLILLESLAKHLKITE